MAVLLSRPNLRVYANHEAFLSSSSSLVMGTHVTSFTPFSGMHLYISLSLSPPLLSLSLPLSLPLLSPSPSPLSLSLSLPCVSVDLVKLISFNSLGMVLFRISWLLQKVGTFFLLVSLKFVVLSLNREKFFLSKEIACFCQEDFRFGGSYENQKVYFFNFKFFSLLFWLSHCIHWYLV